MPVPDAAFIEIVEKTDKEPAYGVIVPDEVRINGIPLLVPADHDIVVHEIDLRAHGAVMVTLTLFARRVVIGAEVSASDALGA